MTQSEYRVRKQDREVFEQLLKHLDSISAAAMLKRSQASRKTGNTAGSSLDRPT